MRGRVEFLLAQLHYVALTNYACSLVYIFISLPMPIMLLHALSFSIMLFEVAHFIIHFTMQLYFKITVSEL